MHDLVRRVLAHEPRAAARLMRLVDDRTGDYLAMLKELHPHTGRAHLVGVTGTPGAGKSTLVDRMIALYRAEGKKVGVVAVDPTSPFSGGAILGDRIRMQRHFLDDGVFIRSVATRGAMGGLSRSANDVVRILDGFGCDVVLIETVGVGQDELEITRTAHTTLVVTPPGGGDDVQASKAGILEIADIFVVNKADREGADAQVRHLESMISLGREIARGLAHKGPSGHGAIASHAAQAQRAIESAPEWTPPVIKTVAARNEGVAELCAAIEQHRVFIASDAGRARRAQRTLDQLGHLLRDQLVERLAVTLKDKIATAATAIDAGTIDPYSACDALIEAFVKSVR
ncbi:MAG: methylmalonyl Co-A mutase-associated GTPase MeaB [Polyangiales bacterium]